MFVDEAAKALLFVITAVLVSCLIGFAFSFGWHEAKSTVQIRDELWVIETMDKIKKKEATHDQ